MSFAVVLYFFSVELSLIVGPSCVNSLKIVYDSGLLRHFYKTYFLVKSDRIYISDISP